MCTLLQGQEMRALYLVAGGTDAAGHTARHTLCEATTGTSHGQSVKKIGMSAGGAVCQVAR